MPRPETTITETCKSCAQPIDLFGGRTLEDVTLFDAISRGMPLYIKLKQSLPVEVTETCTNCSTVNVFDLDLTQKSDVVYIVR